MAGTTNTPGSSTSVKTDVGAIADGVGEIFKTIRENINLTAKNYYSRLLGANSSYKNIFPQYKQSESIFPIIIIIACVFGIVAIVLVKIVQSKK